MIEKNKSLAGIKRKMVLFTFTMWILIDVLAVGQIMYVLYQIST